MGNESKGIKIVFICDEGYVLQTNVTMFSAIVNKKEDTHYKIYIVTTGLSEKSKNLLTLQESETVSIEIVEEKLGDLSVIHRNKKGGYCAATPAALLKFRLPELICEDKVLYLDGDLIIRCDLSELFYTDITDSFVGAVVDSGSLYSQNPTVKKHSNYFNSGVMLMNLQKMREDNSACQLIECKKKSKDHSLMDQHVLNDVFDGKVKLISHRYNCLFVNLVRARNKYAIEQLNERYEENYTSLEDVVKKALIIHYSSKDKPWKYYDVPLANEWYMYYLKFCQQYSIDKRQLQRTSSPFSEKKQEEQKNGVNPKKDMANICMPQDIGVNADVIVSFTSYPARIIYTAKVIESLKKQTIQPNKILLWLAKEQFPVGEKDLPIELLGYTGSNVEIRWCSDLRPHKKYYYAMKEYPDSIIITVDDDIYYERTLIEQLLKSYMKYPYAVSAMRAHLITFDESGKMNAYDKWKRSTKIQGVPSYALCATGVGGVLYPPHCLCEEVFNEAEIRNRCLNADDLWLKTMEILAGTPVVVAGKISGMNYIGDSQECGLWKQNALQKGNDEQFSLILQKYNTYISEKDSILSRMYLAYKEFSTNTSSVNGRDYKAAYEREQRRVKRANREIAAIHASWTYRIGRFITFIPRKIRGGIRCYQEHGMSYTLNRVKDKISAQLGGKR